MRRDWLDLLPRPMITPMKTPKTRNFNTSQTTASIKKILNF